jgi:hypothetical protein
VVDRAVAKDLEILGRTRRWRIFIGLVPGVDHADAVHGPLLDAVDIGRLRNADGVEDRRKDIDHVMELVAHAAGVLDALGPGYHHAGARAAQV